MGWNVFEGFFGPTPWSLASIQVPWGSRPSILAHLEAHLAPGGDGLLEGGERLPDEAAPSETTLAWAPGALDGVLGVHGGPGGDETAARVFEALQRAERQSSQTNLGALYGLLAAGSTLGFVDGLLERIRSDAALRPQRLHALATWLARGAADREAVKAALALLGLVSKRGDEALLLTLGLHEEFTLFAAVALLNTQPDPEPALWRLARSVRGWGRIQTVERLANSPGPDLKAWLLREGFRNQVMDEYLAYRCASAGDLAGALAADEVDDALFDGAGDLLGALIRGRRGPVQGIDHYPQAAAAIGSYLRHAARRARTAGHLVAVKDIEGFLAEQGEEAQGWTRGLREELRAIAAAIAAWPEWRPRLEAGLRTASPAALWEVTAAARALGLDVWEAHFHRTRGGEAHWDEVFRTEDPERVDRALALAAELLPLAEVATGPGQSLGVGPGARTHGHLDFVLQALVRFPGRGWTFIAAGLRSPVIRHRHWAVQALGTWPRSAWPEGAETLLWRCAGEEPHDKVRAALAELLGRAPASAPGA